MLLSEGVAPILNTTGCTDVKTIPLAGPVARVEAKLMVVALVAVMAPEEVIEKLFFPTDIISQFKAVGFEFMHRKFSV